MPHDMTVSRHRCFAVSLAIVAMVSLASALAASAICNSRSYQWSESALITANIGPSSEVTIYGIGDNATYLVLIDRYSSEKWRSACSAQDIEVTAQYIDGNPVDVSPQTSGDFTFATDRDLAVRLHVRAPRMSSSGERLRLTVVDVDVWKSASVASQMLHLLHGTTVVTLCWLVAAIGWHTIARRERVPRRIEQNG